MLSYDEALERILSAVPGALDLEDVPIHKALGRPAASDVFADADLPPFDNSAVDGFALNTGGNESKRQPGNLFSVSGERRAGDGPGTALRPGEAVRIYTGAPTPEGTEAILMVEDSRHEGGDTFRIVESAASPRFIRSRGSDVTRGERVLASGHTLGAAEIGLLAALNRNAVPCARVPRVGILSTGDELIPVGETPLRPGQIRDANGPALAAAVTVAGATVGVIRHANDTAEAVHAALNDLTDCDVILSSGGVSVGDYDVVRSVLEERGELTFWRIAIKPGKPLAFGKVGGKLFFGLPGNPVSSLVTFELFVRPVLRKLAGFGEVTRRQVTARLTAPLAHEPGRREFARAMLEWRDDTYFATPTGVQASHRLSSLRGADCLLIAHEDHGDYSTGAHLQALLLGD